MNLGLVPGESTVGFCANKSSTVTHAEKPPFFDPSMDALSESHPFFDARWAHQKLIRLMRQTVESTPRQDSGISLRQIPNLLRDAFPAAVGFTDASWNSTEPAEVDATDTAKRAAKLPLV